MSSSIISPTTNNATVPSSVDSLVIVDNLPLEPGTYLTAWRHAGEDWELRVDFFAHVGQWAVYGTMGDDTSPLTVEEMSRMLAAHEDAGGIASFLNTSHPLLPKLRDAVVRRAESADLVQTMTSPAVI